jgi:hypothetical protein
VSILLSILTALISCLNYLWWLYGEPIPTVSITSQIVLIVLTITAMATYRKERLRPAYELGQPRIFTLGFGITVLSLIANAGVLIAIVLLIRG